MKEEEHGPAVKVEWHVEDGAEADDGQAYDDSDVEEAEEVVVESQLPSTLFFGVRGRQVIGVMICC